MNIYREVEGGSRVEEGAWVPGFCTWGNGVDPGKGEEGRGEMDLVWGVLHEMRKMSKYGRSFKGHWKYTVSTAKTGVN